MSYSCANKICKMELQNPKPANLVDEPPTPGDIILCGMCGTPNIVVDDATARVMTEDDFAALHPDDLADLQFAQRTLLKR